MIIPLNKTAPIGENFGVTPQLFKLDKGEKKMRNLDGMAVAHLKNNINILIIKIPYLVEFLKILQKIDKIGGSDTKCNFQNNFLEIRFLR